MSELTPEARAIIDAASVGDAPPTGAKKRIHAAILAGIATGAAEGTAGAAAASSAATWGFGLKLLVPLVVVGLGAGGAYMAGVFDADEQSAVSSQQSAVSDPEPQAVVVEPLPVPEPEPVVEPVPEPEPEPEVKPKTKITRAKPQPKPLPEPKPALATAASIKQEQALVNRARKALAAGDYTAALTVAAEHANRFPNGQFAQEREAVRVRAVCNVGEATTAVAAAQKFLATWPKSPYAAKVRASCKLEP